jgi:transposase-like protein
MATTQPLTTPVQASLTASGVRNLGFEARSLVRMVKKGFATVEQVRRQIGENTPYRKHVLLSFDAQRADFTRELRATVITLLRTHSCRTVHAKLGIPHKIIRRISIEAHMTWRKAGRGRRISPAQREKILAAICADGRSLDIQREFGVSDWFVQRLRHEIGIREDRRKRRSWDIERVKQALNAGLSLAEIERTHGIQHAVLWKLRKKLGDLEDRRGRQRRILSDAERAAISADIRAGVSQRKISCKFHLHTQRVHALQVEAGLPPRRCRVFTAAEISKIRMLFASGRTNAGIARDLSCSRAAISLRRKKELYGQS